MSRTVYVNGEYLPEEEARVSIFDRGFLMADGVYEVTSVLDGKLIDFGKGREAPARELIREMIEWFLDDVLDELGTRREVEYAYRILTEGTSADRQLATFQKTNDLKAVVDQLVAETAEGVT